MCPQEPGRNVSFLFNLWREEPEFRRLVNDSRFAGWSSQVLGATAVRVLEDNALTKDADSGGELRWHQDYSYWPLGQPNAVTIWIALDVSPSERCHAHGAGSQLLGERLPAVFGTGAVVLRRPAAGGRCARSPTRRGAGLDVERASSSRRARRRCTTPSPGTRPGANVTDQPRRAAVAGYVADGTTWFGARRYEFNYTDEELGLTPGDPSAVPYFPVVPGPRVDISSARRIDSGRVLPCADRTVIERGIGRDRR